MRRGGEALPLLRTDGDEAREEGHARDLRAEVHRHGLRVGIVVALRDQIGDEDCLGAVVGDVVLHRDGGVHREQFAVDLDVDAHAVLGTEGAARLF